MPTAEVNGIQLYYEVHGSGEPLVVINGLGAELSQSTATTGALAEKFKVLAFDNRGVGRSGKPKQPYSIDVFAADAVALMQATGFASANVLGISMGGRIALELTLQHPEMVSRLVLVSTGARVQSTLTRLVFTSSVWKHLYQGEYPQPRYAFVRQRQASNHYDATSRLSQIAAPTLVLHGELDRVALLTVARELHEGIKGSRLLTFKGGHSFFLNREPDRFLRTVTEFLA